MASSKPCLPAAVKLLAVRDYSEAELRGRLARQGHQAEAVDAAVEELRRRGYLNDENLGRRILDRCREEGRYGRLAIRRRLEGKGLPPATVAALLAEYDDAGEYERAAAVACARFSSSGADAARVGRYLAARGFAGDTIMLVLSRLYDYDANG